MKGFIGGILATLAAGLLLFGFQKGYENLFEVQRAKVEYRIYKPDLRIKDDEFENWVSSFSREAGERQVSIRFVSIKNSGETSLQNQQVKVVSSIDGFDDSGVFGFRNAFLPADEDKDSVKASIKNRELNLVYPLLKPGESHEFWLITDIFTTPNIVIRSPNLVVSGFDTEILNREGDIKSTNKYFIFSIFISIVFGLMGFGLCDNLYKRMLRTYNLDNKKMVKAWGSDKDYELSDFKIVVSDADAPE